MRRFSPLHFWGALNHNIVKTIYEEFGFSPLRFWGGLNQN